MRKNEFKISKRERILLAGERICAKWYNSCIIGGVILGLTQFAFAIALECTNTNKHNKNIKNYGNARRS